MQTLRLTSKKPEVAIWQRILLDPRVTIDGVFGPQTEAATKIWQEAHGLVADGIVGPKTWAAALSPAESSMLRGLDASSVQTLLPYDQLEGEYDFVILKGQQGNDHFDPYFERNAKGAIDHGIEPFAYTYGYPLPTTLLRPSRDPKKQAALAVERTFKAAPFLEGRPLFNDYEFPEVVARPPKVKKGWKEWGCSPPQIADWMRDNAAETHRLSKRKPVIYIYDWWWRAVRDGAPAYGFPEKGDVSWAEDYDLWMAWYVNDWPIPGQDPRVPAPFKDWLFWQFDGNDGLRLPNGVDCDFCVFNGDKADLAAFIKGDGTSAKSTANTADTDVAPRR